MNYIINMNLLNLFRVDPDKQLSQLLEKINELGNEVHDRLELNYETETIKDKDVLKYVKLMSKAEKYDTKRIIKLYFNAARLFELGKFKEAIKVYDEIIHKNPKILCIHIQKGICLEDIKKLKEAIKCYDEALKINPNSDSALNNKGIALCSLKKYKEGISCFDRVLELKSNDKVALGNKEKAINLLK